jgi:EAL domain-containing protein (putative c-di-GMP-specific phosphodiesterase class I)
MLPKLERRVIAEIFSQLAQHPHHLEALHLCAINLSAAALCDDKLPAYIVQQLADNHIAADKICFEITETVAVSNLADTVRFINILKKQGCRFALDNFGSGLATFAYLKTLPVDFLKINGNFVKSIVDDAVHFTIVRSIHDIAQTLGKKTIAEFVENNAIHAKLHDVGVDYVQGYAVGRPQPFSAILTAALPGSE